MNEMTYSTLLEVLAVIPDPRKARGQRYAWIMLLTLLVAGLVSGQQTSRAIAQWIRLHIRYRYVVKATECRGAEAAECQQSGELMV